MGISTIKEDTPAKVPIFLVHQHCYQPQLAWTVYLLSLRGRHGDKLIQHICLASSFGNVGYLKSFAPGAFGAERGRLSPAAELFSGRILSPSGPSFAEAPDSLMTSLHT